MTVIVTKNSSTASAVPLTSDLVQGELAVNVTDKRIFTENASTQIVELGTNPSTITTATATVTGTLTANGTFASSNAVLTGGTVNGIVIGGTTPQAITGTTVTANTGFVGGLTGDVTGNVTGNLTGNVTGDVTGSLIGNVTAATGTTTLNNLAINGTVDFNTAVLSDLGAPVLATDAATKGYVDTEVAAVVAAAPAALDTLNELAAALGDDANFSTTVTNSIATKLPLAGGTMSGAIAMGTSKITGLGNPTLAQDAATKTYVDTADALKLPLAGGTMSGAIAMGTNKITGLGDPTLAQDATTKTYVDTILGSATAAADSAAAAATSESNAATSASNASTSETNAAASETNAAASYDAFDDRYLGQKASAPTLDNDGAALLTGAIYFNTTSTKMQVYTGSAWVDVAPTATSVTVSQISDVTATATEINYIDGVTSAIQTQIDGKEAADATIVKDADIGVTVQGYDADTAKYDDTTANFTGTLQNGGSNVVVDSDIDSTVAGYVAPSTSGNVLTSNGSVWTSAAPAAGGFSAIEEITTSQTWTVPAGVTRIKVIATGGGGGAGSSDLSGGGAGATAIKYLTVAPAGSVVITIGAGGTASNTSPGAGGDTTAVYSVTTITAGGGQGGGARGGDGGSTTSGDVNILGGTAIEPDGSSYSAMGGASYWGGGHSTTYGAGPYGSGGNRYGFSASEVNNDGAAGVVVIEY